MRDQHPQSADVAIIGAGPIGVELAVALKQARVNYVQFDAGAIGSTFQWWAPGTRFFSSPERIEIAGVPLVTTHQEKATREEYLAYLRGVVQQFSLEVQSFRRVESISRAGDGFELLIRPSAHGVGGPAELVPNTNALDDKSDAAHWRVQRIVFAIGNMHRPRMLDVPGEQLPHVSHYLGEPHEYFGRRMLIVGGRNSAVEAALRLYRVGAHVAMSYRGGEFDSKRIKYWLRPELEWLISKKLIEFHPLTTVTEITPDRVCLSSMDDDQRRVDVRTDGVLLLTGYVQDSTLFSQLGAELAGDEDSPRFDPSTMETNVPGVFVAGTAAGGSQKRAKLFIENTHVHVHKIVRAIAGQDVPWSTARDFGALEQ